MDTACLESLPGIRVNRLLLGLRRIYFCQRSKCDHVFSRKRNNSMYREFETATPDIGIQVLSKCKQCFSVHDIACERRMRLKLRNVLRVYYNLSHRRRIRTQHNMQGIYRVLMHSLSCPPAEFAVRSNITLYQLGISQLIGG